MQEQTFDALDHALKVAGNVRTASVRSDLLLHVPRMLKAPWGVEDDYIVFVGQQQGMIVEEEIRFESNLVFPWLDNRSFNKWFQPDGCDRPFGSLEIAAADEVDFRRKSFEKMFGFFESKRYTNRPTKQLEIPLEQNPNVIVCGYTCAGKTTASQHLARKFGYLHIEASDFMYLSYFYRHEYQGPVPIGDFAEQALAVKPHIAAEKISEYLEENVSSPTVISGFRSPDEIGFLTTALTPHGRRFQTIFVSADEPTRFNRLAARMRPGDDMTIEAFRERDNQQRRMGLELIRSSKAAKLIFNNGTLADYLGTIDSVVGLASRDEIDITVALGRAAAVEEVKLEDAILIALLTVSSDDEAHPFLSTTQISRRIRHVFPQIKPKHKDNVSRYFNQDFYAYYEIATSTAGLSGKRTYRLSNTGYGRAVRALRDLVRRRSDDHF
jgi:dephospho-CoA kinase